MPRQYVDAEIWRAMVVAQERVSQAPIPAANIHDRSIGRVNAEPFRHVEQPSGYRQHRGMVLFHEHQIAGGNGISGWN